VTDVYSCSGSDTAPIPECTNHYRAYDTQLQGQGINGRRLPGDALTLTRHKTVPQHMGRPHGVGGEGGQQRLGPLVRNYLGPWLVPPDTACYLGRRITQYAQAPNISIH
jgi:hypothetical protein